MLEIMPSLSIIKIADYLSKVTAVLNKVFINQADTIISEDASNGDKYIVTIKKFNQPLETDIQNIIEEYNTFSEEIFVTRMNQIVNNDIFESARVNLNNLIF